MLSNFFSLNIFFEFVCFIFALLYLLKDSNAVWRLMIWLLGVTVLTETTGRYVMLTTATHFNGWVYNIFIVFQAVSISIMFTHLFSRYIAFKPFAIGGLALLSFCYAYDIYTKSFLIYSGTAFTVMSVLFAVYGLLYYFLLFKNDEYVDLRYSAAFWWVAGVLFYFFGLTVSNLFDQQLNNAELGGHNLNFYVYRLLNFILYGLWSYSFFCRKRMLHNRDVGG